MFSDLKKFIRKNSIVLSVILILIVAAFMRLYQIADYMTFLGDEGRDVLVVREILHGNLTFLGPRASAGDFYLGPIYYYFMAPFLLLSNFHPVGPAIMVALFGVITVFLVYYIGFKIKDHRAGLVAASLYAVSPLVIAYSRSSWNPNLMPFFSIITLWAALRGLESRKWFYFVISGVSLGIALQLHYLSLFLGAILFFYVALSEVIEKRLGSIKSLIKDYLLIGFGFIMGFSLFLLFELKNSFPNTKTIINFIFNSGEVTGSGKFMDIIVDVFFRMYARLLTFYRGPGFMTEDTEPVFSFWFYITMIFAIVSLSFVVYKTIEKIKKKDVDMKKYLLLTLWFVLGVFFFGFYKKSIYDYYFGFMFPVPFLITGVLFAYLWDKGKIFKISATVGFLVLFLVNLNGHPFQYPPNKQYEQVKKISEFVISKTDNKPYNFALGTGGNSDHAYRYILVSEGREPVTILNPSEDPKRESVKDQLMVICEGPCQPLGHSLWEIAGFGRAEIDGEWDLKFVKVYRLVHYKEGE